MVPAMSPAILEGNAGEILGISIIARPVITPMTTVHGWMASKCPAKPARPIFAGRPNTTGTCAAKISSDPAT